MRRKKIHQIARSHFLIADIYEGRKTYEIQPIENDYQVGDYIVYKIIWSSEPHKNHPIENVKYVITHCDKPCGLREDYIAFSIKKEEN